METNEVTHYSQDIQANFFAALEGKPVSIAGRIMTKRGHGKSLARLPYIQDSKGRIQVYIRQTVSARRIIKIFQELDIGDIIGVSGRSTQNLGPGR